MSVEQPESSQALSPDDGPTRMTFADAGNPSARFEAASPEDAARRLLSFVSELVTKVGPDVDTVRVVGRGALGKALVERLGHETVEVPPRCVIDTTGDIDRLKPELTSLRDGGLLLLASHVRHASWALDPYPDLHSRGLTIEGASLEHVVPDPNLSDAELDRLLEELVVTGSTPPSDGSWLWCRFVSDADTE